MLGGAEECLLDLIASLRASTRELDVQVLSLGDGPLLAAASALGATTDVLPLPEALATLGESGGFEGWRRGASGALGLVGWLPRFAKVLDSKRANVLHSNGLKTHLLAALAKPAGIPLVWHFHDFLSERTLTSRVLPRLQRRASLGIAVSEAVARDARRVIRTLPLRTMLNGIRTERFAPGQIPPADLDALGRLSPSPPGTVRVGLVATYASWKGHCLFLDAVSRIDASNARFYIVGGPVYATRGSQLSEVDLRARIAQLGLEQRCALVPFQRNIASVYAGLDVVVHASIRPEPFGRTIAEGMASGRAVIAAGAGGTLEQIEHGINGLIFEPGDSIGLTKEMALLIHSPELRAKLQTAALIRARRYLDAARLGPMMAGIYSSLCEADALQAKAR